MAFTQRFSISTVLGEGKLLLRPFYGEEGISGLLAVPRRTQGPRAARWRTRRRRMRPWSTGVGFCMLVVSLGGASSARAQETEPSYELEVGYEYSNRYIFRGVDLLDGEPTPTSRVIFTKGGLSTYYYGYFGHIGYGGPDLEEHDFGADYTFTRGKLGLTLGGVAYTYRQPSDWEDTTEVYAIASLDVMLAPTFTAAQEIESGGRYLSLGVSHELPLWRDCLTLGLGTTVAYDMGYWSEEFELEQRRGWSDLLLRTSLTWKVAGALYAYASVQQSVSLEVLDAAGQEDETTYAVGAMLDF